VVVSVAATIFRSTGGVAAAARTGGRFGSLDSCSSFSYPRTTSRAPVVDGFASPAAACATAIEAMARFSVAGRRPARLSEVTYSVSVSPLHGSGCTPAAEHQSVKRRQSPAYPRRVSAGVPASTAAAASADSPDPPRGATDPSVAVATVPLTAP
jgi:hypothetical protein